MKKLILLLSFAFPLWGLAQSATILPNSLALPKVSALPACNTNQKGTQVMNNTDNKMYYCNGTNWQEMTGGGFTLPYSDSVNSSSNVLYLENSGSGRVIYAKSSNATAVRAESGGGYGLYAVSNSYYAVYGTSTSGIAIYGNSSSYYAGYFVAYGSQPTLYVSNGGSGMAADFRGDVNVRNELTVDDGKGIVRSNSSTQQKVVRITGGFGVSNLGVGDYIDSGNLNYENFGGVPTVTVGQVVNVSATGDWYKVTIIPINVTATECQLRLVNLSGSAITFTGTWHFLIIGPE